MVRSLPWHAFYVAVLSLAISCSPAEPAATPTAGTPIPGRPVSAAVDPELAEAVQQAQDTLHIWRQEFLAPKRAYSMTSLKVRFVGESRVEDMWTEPVYVLDNLYTVRLIEGVTLETGIHPERLLDVKPDEIVDWMLLETDGTVIGGYILRQEYQRMSPEQQKRYREITGYRFE